MTKEELLGVLRLIRGTTSLCGIAEGRLRQYAGDANGKD